MKFDRNYKLTIQDNPNGITPADTAIEIAYPLTINFEVSRSIGGENSLNLQIINLAETTKAKLVKDRFNIQSFGSGGQFRQIRLDAGYGQNINTIFVGSILEGYSERVGTEMVTSIYAMSGAFGRYNTFINQSFSANTPSQHIVDYVVNQLVAGGDIKKGAITQIDGTFQTGYSALGDSFNILSEFGVAVFVDLDRINLVKIDEVIKTLGPNDIFLISSETGLLGTPMRRDTFIEVTMIFEPQINLAQLVEIKSETDPRFNGQYKVMGIKHKGIISGAVNGPLTTTLQLWIGVNLVNGFKQIQ